MRSQARSQQFRRSSENDGPAIELAEPKSAYAPPSSNLEAHLSSLKMMSTDQSLPNSDETCLSVAVLVRLTKFRTDSTYRFRADPAVRRGASLHATSLKEVYPQQA